MQFSEIILGNYQISLVTILEEFTSYLSVCTFSTCGELLACIFMAYI